MSSVEGDWRVNEIVKNHRVKNSEKKGTYRGDPDN